MRYYFVDFCAVLNIAQFGVCRSHLTIRFNLCIFVLVPEKKIFDTDIATAETLSYQYEKCAQYSIV